MRNKITYPNWQNIFFLLASIKSLNTPWEVLGNMNRFEWGQINTRSDKLQLKGINKMDLWHSDAGVLSNKFPNILLMFSTLSPLLHLHLLSLFGWLSSSIVSNLQGIQSSLQWDPTLDIFASKLPLLLTLLFP